MNTLSARAVMRHTEKCKMSLDPINILNSSSRDVILEGTMWDHDLWYFLETTKNDVISKIYKCDISDKINKRKNGKQM